MTVSAWLGGGWGTASVGDTHRGSGYFALGAEIGGSPAPGRYATLSLEGTGAVDSDNSGYEFADFFQPSLREVGAGGLFLGYEVSPAHADEIVPFVRLGLGCGRFGALGVRDRTVTAATTAFGIHLLPRPGPLGFTLALRSYHALGGGASLHALVPSVGLTVRPHTR